jgi:hypothetical protein
MPADTEQVFARRVDGDDEEILVEHAGARVQMIDNVVRQRALRASRGSSGIAVPRGQPPRGFTIVVCCT